MITNIDGRYKFDYSVVIQVPDASPNNVYTVTVGPSINHQDATSYFSTTLNIDSNNIYYFNKSTINNLNKGDNVSLVIKSNKVGNFIYSEANMLVNRVSEKFGRIPTTG